MSCMTPYFKYNRLYVIFLLITALFLNLLLTSAKHTTFLCWCQQKNLLIMD